MKIVYTTLGLDPCGGVRVLIEHCNRLTDRGHDVYLIPLQPHRGPEEQGRIASGYPASAPGVQWMPTRCNLAPPERLEDIAKDADILVATEANTAEPIAKLETSAKKFYFIQMRESLFFMYTNPLWAGKVELNYQNMKGVLSPIAISWWLKDFLEQEYGYEDVPIVPNGVNREMFYPDPKFPKGDKPRVLIEGHHHSEAKDVAFMSYKAADYYRENIQPLEVWGFSQLPPQYKGFNRFWLGPSQDEIRQIYSSCDVLLKASRFEGRSCVEVEAMACGLPVVRAILEGTDDLIHGWNCLKVKYGDLNGYITHLAGILAQDMVRQMLVTNGLKYVKEQLDWNPFIDRLELIFDGGTPDAIPRTQDVCAALEEEYAQD